MSVRAGLHVPRGELRDFGRGLLPAESATPVGLRAARERLVEAAFDAAFADEPQVWLSGVLALRAAAMGNFGVGALLVDGNGAVVAIGHNQLFHPHFRSDRHAEMSVMEVFEDAFPERAAIADHTLYTSLEPCPMCTVRLATASLGRIVYAAPDEAGGMASRPEELPAFWRELALDKRFAAADCSAELRQIALDIFLSNCADLLQAVRRRGLGAP